MNSTLPWIKNVPKHWKVVPLKAVANYFVSSVDKLSEDDELPVELCNYTDVYKNEFIDNTLEFMKASATQEEIIKYQLQEGDVIITKDSESWDDIAIPALVTSVKPNLLCGYHLALIRSYSKRLYSQYLFRCLQSKEIRLQLELSSTGVTRFGLPKSDIGRMLLPLPSIDTQKRISAFLDKEIKHIDALVRAKNELSSTLAEKRKTLIRQLVTQGLNPKSKMKDSGIEWLGAVPSHWVLKKIKYLSKLKSGEFITADSISENGIYPVYGGNGLRGFTSDKTHVGEYVLIGRQGALCGNVNYAHGEFWASEHAIVCIPVEKYQTIWFGELLRVMNLNQYSAAAAQPGLSVETITNLMIPVPPIEEQKKIVNYMNSEIRNIDDIINANEKSVRLLKERKSVLITASVTGQIQISTV